MTVSSADPDKLQEFVRGAKYPRISLREQALTVAAAEVNVRSRSPHGGVTTEMLHTFPSRLLNMGENEQFVATIRTELLAADRSGGTILSAPDAKIRSALRKAGLATPPPRQPFALNTVLPGHPTQGFVDDPVSAFTGNMLHDEADLMLPGIAVAITVQRRYNSRLHDRAGAFGASWSSTLDVELVRVDGRIDIRLADGAIVSWQEVEGEWGAFGNRILDVVESESGGWTVIETRRRHWHFDRDGHCTGWTDGPAFASFERDANGRISSITEATTGRRLDITWDQSLVTSMTSNDGREVRYHYDGTHLSAVDAPTGRMTYDWSEAFITTIRDGDGVALFTNTYDADGRVTSQTSPFGRHTGYEYSDNGMTVISDDNGVRQAMVHDERGNLTAIIDVDGSAMRLRYDEHDRVAQVTDKAGNSTNYEYDPSTSELLRRIDPDGLSIELGWDDVGRLVSLRQRSGGVWQYRYTGDSWTPIEIVDAAGATTRLEIDPRFDEPSAVTDPDGVTLDIERNADGQVSEVRVAGSLLYRLGYDDHGFVASATDASGATTSLSNEPSGRTTGAQRGLWTAEFEYSLAGRLIAGELPGVGHWKTTFGSHGSPVRVEDAAGRGVGYQYDQVGEITAIVAPDGARYDQLRDELGRLVATADPSGSTTRIEYDVRGQQNAVIDAEGRRFTRTFDSLGRMSSMTGPSGDTTSYEYYADGQLAAVTAADGRVWRLDADPCGRVLALTAPGGSRSEVTYSPGGRLIERRSPEGRVERLGYDASGRLASMTTDDGVTVNYSYDAGGRLARMDTDPGGESIELERNEQGDIVSVVRNGRATRLDRDVVGRIIAQTDATGVTARFGYDDRGLLVSATEPSGATTTYSYDDRGRLVGRVGPGGGETTWQYDGAGLLEARTDPAGVTTRFHRDRSGLVTGASRGSAAWSAELDELGRQISVQGSDGSTLGQFAYGRNGRLTSSISANGWAALFEWDDDGRLGQLASTGPAGAVVGPPGTASDSGSTQGDAVGSGLDRFDDAGRLLADGRGTVYRYDSAGRLAEVADATRGSVQLTYGDDGLISEERAGGQVRHFAYDAAGRVSRIESSDGHAVTIDYDDSGRRTSERSDDGTSTEYAWNDIDQLIEIHRADDAGVRSSLTIEYDGLGRIATINGSPVATTGLSTFEPLSNLVLLGVRVLDRSTSQFLSPDPLEAVPATNGSASDYSYAWQDPITFVDPIGLRPVRKEDFDAFHARPIESALDRAWDRYKYLVPGVALYEGVSAAASWAWEHKGWIAVGAMVVGGAALIAFGGPLLVAGGVGMLVAMGASAAGGNYNNPGQLILDGAIGFAGGIVGAGIGSSVSGAVLKIGGKTLAGQAGRVAASAVGDTTVATIGEVGSQMLENRSLDPSRLDYGDIGVVAGSTAVSSIATGGVGERFLDGHVKASVAFDTSVGFLDDAVKQNHTGDGDWSLGQAAANTTGTAVSSTVGQFNSPEADGTSLFTRYRDGELRSGQAGFVRAHQGAYDAPTAHGVGDAMRGQHMAPGRRPPHATIGGSAPSNMGPRDMGSFPITDVD